MPVSPTSSVNGIEDEFSTDEEIENHLEPEGSNLDFFEKESSNYQIPINVIKLDLSTDNDYECFRKRCIEFWKCLESKPDFKPIEGVGDIETPRVKKTKHILEKKDKKPTITWSEKLDEFTKLGLHKTALINVKCCRFCEFDFKLHSEDYVPQYNGKNDTCHEFIKWDRDNKSKKIILAAENESEQKEVFPWNAYNKNEKSFH